MVATEFGFEGKADTQPDGYGPAILKYSRIRALVGSRGTSMRSGVRGW